MYVDDDGEEGDGIDGNNNGDSDGNGIGDGNSNDAAAAANGDDVNEDDSGDSRMTIEHGRLDEDNGMMAMKW
jgi:hypothetical protein